MTQEDFERLKSALEKNLSAPGLSFVLAGLWTKDEIPEIRSPEQYEAYQQIEAKLSSVLPPKDDPGYGEAFVAFTRSREGILATSYGARMIEWKELQEGGE